MSVVYVIFFLYTYTSNFFFLLNLFSLEPLNYTFHRVVRRFLTKWIVNVYDDSVSDAQVFPRIKSEHGRKPAKQFKSGRANSERVIVGNMRAEVVKQHTCRISLTLLPRSNKLNESSRARQVQTRCYLHRYLRLGLTSFARAREKRATTRLSILESYQKLAAIKVPRQHPFFAFCSTTMMLLLIVFSFAVGEIGATSATNHQLDDEFGESARIELRSRKVRSLL